MSAKRPLTPKARAFVDQYQVDMNATQAAIRAGYSERSARVTGQKLLADPRVAGAIAAKAQSRAKRVGLEADEILGELAYIGRVDIGDAYDNTGALKPLHEMPESVRRCIASVESIEQYDDHGALTGVVRKVKFWSKPHALEMSGRHRRLFADVIQHDVTDRLADAMREAEERIANRG